MWCRRRIEKSTSTEHVEMKKHFMVKEKRNILSTVK
jgi:hypothetical protein